MKKINFKKYNKVKKTILIIKNLLKRILNTLVIILLMKLDQFIIMIKKSKGIYGTASKDDLKELKEEG